MSLLSIWLYVYTYQQIIWIYVYIYQQIIWIYVYIYQQIIWIYVHTYQQIIWIYVHTYQQIIWLHVCTLMKLYLQPHKYIVEAQVLKESWPLSESSWSFIQMLRELEKNELKGRQFFDPFVNSISVNYLDVLSCDSHRSI